MSYPGQGKPEFNAGNCKGNCHLADIFVSYASSDRSKVEPFVAHLEAAGFSVWWDRQLQGGSMFSREIEAEVKQARVVLVVWSPDALESRWVADEAELALQTGKLVPITLGGVQAPMGFRQLHALDFSSTDLADPEKIQSLVSAIQHHLSDAERVAQSATEPETPDTSIAVLPFVNMSADPEQEFFADGISEELLNLLAKIPHMRVAARTSSFQFKGQNLTISKIGEELNVAHILEGSVRKAGNRVRITSQLIKAEDGYHLWSETYDRTLDDIFAIQDEISAAIVSSLKELVLGEGLTPVAAPVVERTENLDAYELYLLGIQVSANRSLVNCQKGANYLERAIAIDPNFGPAYADLAILIILTSNDVGCFGMTPVAEAGKKAWPYVERALDLAPEDPKSHLALAAWHRLSRNLEDSEAAAHKALEINPNLIGGHSCLMFVKLFRGSPYDRFLTIQRDMLAIDPLSLNNLGNYSTHLIEYAMFEEARTVTDKLWSLDPAGTSPLFRKMELSEYRGDTAAVLKWALDFPGTIEQGPLLLVLHQALFTLGLGRLVEHLEARLSLSNYLMAGDLEGARRTAKAVMAAPDDFSPYRRELALAFLDAIEGRTSEALARISPFDEPDPEKWGIHFNPEDEMLGAQLSAWTRQQTGDDAGAEFYKAKLREVFEAHLQDPDGTLYFTYKVGASVAAMDGDKNRALDLIDKQVERSNLGAQGILLAPWFSSLRDDPRFKAAMAKLDAHVEAEKARAEGMGLLPLSPKIEAFWRTIKMPEALSLTGALANDTDDNPA